MTDTCNVSRVYKFDKSNLAIHISSIVDDTRNVDRQIRFVKFIHSADIACICHCPDVFFYI